MHPPLLRSGARANKDPNSARRNSNRSRPKILPGNCNTRSYRPSQSTLPDTSDTLYFVVVFERPSTDSGTWNGDTLTPGSTESAGNQPGAYLTFDTATNSVVQAKVGLSFVSFTNAYANLTTENLGWDFDAVRKKAAAAWNTRLATVQVGGGPDGESSVMDDQKTVFYTALYHASIHPSTFSDAKGEYRGFDGKTHHTARTQYHNIPSWDFYRSLVPLLTITAPDVASDLAQSLVNDAQQDPGGGMPRWVHAATDSCGMFGDGSSKIVAIAYAFGARDFDAPGALSAMIRAATQPGTTSAGCPVREGLEDYLTLGYVSTSTWGSAARTLEYAASDFSISQLGGWLGDTETHNTFIKRAQSWRNLLRDGYIVPRLPDGRFFPDFSPDGCVGDGFVEGSGAQYGLMVRFNQRALFNAMCLDTAAIARLHRHFQHLNAGPCSEFAFMGNEPSLKSPWMYAFAGAPWKTQQTVRRILSELYSNSPGGMPGNDDGGVLSSWVVFASLGLYPVISGGFRSEALGGACSRQYKSLSVKRESGLGRKSEQFADEVSFADHISFGQPSHSALPDHVHGLYALQRPPHTLQQSIALGQPNSLLTRLWVLLIHVLECVAQRKAEPPGLGPT